MKMKKILKVVAILISIIIILLLVHTIRNYVIITDLQEKISNYYDCTNYHTKHIAKQDNGTITTVDYYKKDDKQVYLIEKSTNEKIQRITVYGDGETKNAYIENNDEKIALLNSKIVMYISIYNSLDVDDSIFIEPDISQYKIKENI